MKFTGIEQLRQVEWGRSYLWDLDFSFKPFKNSNNAKLVANLGNYIPFKLVGFIPADSMSETFAAVNSSEVTVGQNTFRFAISSSPKELNINFIDDLNGSTKRWLNCWMNSIILGNGKGMNYLEDYVDILLIKEKDLKGNTIRTKNYLVYPDGQAVDQFTSDSGLKVFSMNFVVAGESR